MFFQTRKNIWFVYLLIGLLLIKVFPETVEKYTRKIENGENIDPIIVVKHPKYDVYAVLGGHHRYFCLS